MTQPWQQQERRKHWRYPCAGEALVRREGDSVALEGVLSDISLGGCYVDMMHPLPSEARIELTFGLDQRRVRAKGRVCASREGFGMGVSFTEIHGEDQAVLEDLVSWLAGSLPQGTAQDARPSATTNEEDSIEAPTVTPHSDLDTASALDALLELLECKGVVSAEECVKVAQKIVRHPNGRLDARDGSARNPALRASD